MPKQSKNAGKRITIARVRAAYKATGLIPCQGASLRYDTIQAQKVANQSIVPQWRKAGKVKPKFAHAHACAIGAVTIAESIITTLPEFTPGQVYCSAAPYLGLSDTYVTAFIDAFDLPPEYVSPNYVHPVGDFEHGTNDGNKVRRALFGA